MARDYDRTRLFTRRAFLMGGAKLGLLSLLGGRIYYLQVLEGEKYRTLAEENRVNLKLLAPPRGQILDDYGVPMALNQQNYRAVLSVDQVADLEGLLRNLQPVLPLTEPELTRIRRDFQKRNRVRTILVRDNLPWDEVAALSLHNLELTGLDIEVGAVRAYPYAQATAHVLGYVGVVSERDKEEEHNEPLLNLPGFQIGKAGIEKEYDKKLRGKPGAVQLEVNAHGRVVRELTRDDPENGADLPLTIDIGLQEFTRQTLAEHKSAAAVVMDIHTGAIKSLVSHPAYDPNLFTYGISEEDWGRLNSDPLAPLLNKTVNGAYSPGSAFKPVVALAALEAGLLKPDTIVFCPGYLDLGSHRFHCWKRGGHGPVNLEQAMAGSCDTFFYEIGRRVGIDRIQAMANRLGLGHKLGIDLPQERSGLIPSRAWKRAVRGQAWQQGETLVTAIGQGSVLTTPLQLAVMGARLSNGGLAVVPHLLKKEEDAKPAFESLGLDPDHIKLVLRSMDAVLKPGGTAYGARILEQKWAMGGKTGTSQVRRISMAERETGVLKNAELPWKLRDHALFVGYAPVKKPRFVAAVVVEHGGSGAHDAAPVARDLLREVQRRAAEGVQ